MIRLHPRTRPVSSASTKLRMLVLDFAEEHDLTDVEMLKALHACERDFLTALLRAERHPDDPERKADEA